MKFTASQFEDYRNDRDGKVWDTAERKAKTANALFAFLEAGCPERLFTEQLYHDLMQHAFAHIAHYNSGGFYAEWFSTAARRASWVAYALTGGWLGFHRPEGSQGWGDWERAVVAELRARGMDESFARLAAEDAEAAEVSEFLRLSAKYG